MTKSISYTISNKMDRNITMERQNARFFCSLEQMSKNLKNSLPRLSIIDIRYTIIGWGTYLTNPPKYLKSLASEHICLINQVIEYLEEELKTRQKRT